MQVNYNFKKCTKTMENLCTWNKVLNLVVKYQSKLIILIFYNNNHTKVNNSKDDRFIFTNIKYMFLNIYFRTFHKCTGSERILLQCVPYAK